MIERVVIKNYKCIKNANNNGWNYFISNKNIKLYDFCFDINDNGGSTLRFNSEKYDCESILHNIRAFYP